MKELAKYFRAYYSSLKSAFRTPCEELEIAVLRVTQHLPENILSTIPLVF